jgi:hypothetical protein
MTVEKAGKKSASIPIPLQHSVKEEEGRLFRALGSVRTLDALDATFRKGGMIADFWAANSILKGTR